MTPLEDAFAAPCDEPGTLVDVLDRLLDRGVVVSGDLRISVADVDLLFVGLKLFLSSVDTIETAREKRLEQLANAQKKNKLGNAA